MTIYGFQYDYSRTMMMKLYMAEPDHKGGTRIYTDYAQAIELVKKMDKITLGIPKVLYLVGWQYNGHDDRYPEMFELNEALKRPEDKTAMDSLKALIEVGKQNHTVISFHTNFTDCYKTSKLFNEFVEAGAIQRNKQGELYTWEGHEEQDCYKASYKQYYESGLFKKVADKFLATFPFIIEAGTLHIDNMQAYNSAKPYVSMHDQIVARNKMLDYFIEKGIDVTSEGIWREKEDIWEGWSSYDNTQPMHCLGRFAASWWPEYANDKEYLETPLGLHSGGIDRSRYGNVYYGNIHGEEVWKNNGTKADEWVAPYTFEFATIEVPYLYLNTLKRTKIDTGVNPDGSEYKIGFFDENVISFGNTKTITVNGVAIKEGNNLCLPFVLKKDTYYAYSEDGSMKELVLVDCEKKTVKISEITAYGYKEVGSKKVTDGKIKFVPEAGKAYIIE